MTGSLQNKFSDIQVSLTLDDSGDHMMARHSFIGVYADAEMSTPLFHYDYERHKPDGYPEAHVQVVASSPAWEQVLSKRTDACSDVASLHLPVGGRRYRPTLEDVVEFLVVEKLVDARSTWANALNAGRELFQERQLRAAIRMKPVLALDQLRRDGHLPSSGPPT